LSTRYLYLLFDTENFIHGQGISGKPHRVASRSCMLDTGAYIFNTEAHPMDVGALDCCHGPTERDIWQKAWFPKRSSKRNSPESSDDKLSIVSSSSIETCKKPHWQSFLWIKSPPTCSASSAASKSWTGKRRRSSLYSLLTCEAAPFMQMFCIGGEVCDI
jgi:mannosidase alpha-like ER degradation enhancer 2